MGVLSSQFAQSIRFLKTDIWRIRTSKHQTAEDNSSSYSWIRRRQVPTARFCFNILFAPLGCTCGGHGFWHCQGIWF